MAKIKLFIKLVAMGTCIAISSTAYTAEEFLYTATDPSVTVSGGVGYVWFKANQGTYDDFGRISQLIWKSDTPVVTTRVASEYGDHWKVTTSGAIGFLGNSNMKDYDWLELSTSSDFGDWDHLSVHPDTDLDRYLNLDFAMGRDFALNDALSIDIHGGLKYTNTKWTARGGAFIYSEGSFRDTTGSFPDGEPVATFEQRYPGLFLGTEATAIDGDWTFTGLVRGGATINATDTDHHWIRGIRFERDYSAIPFFSLDARADYAINNRITGFFYVNFDKYFHKKGDTNVYSLDTGEMIGGPFINGAGSNFTSITINVGFKASF